MEPLLPGFAGRGHWKAIEAAVELTSAPMQFQISSIQISYRICQTEAGAAGHGSARLPWRLLRCEAIQAA